MTLWSITALWLIASCSGWKANESFVPSRADQKETLDVTAPSSVCYNATGVSSTVQYDCTDGEVQLLGRYLQIGLDNVNSLGTVSAFSSSYYSGQLGIIADYDKDGFETGSPGYSGDFFLPADSVEGMSYIRCTLSCYMRRMQLKLCLYLFRVDHIVQEQR
jgi:hypothetical protein